MTTSITKVLNATGVSFCDFFCISDPLWSMLWKLYTEKQSVLIAYSFQYSPWCVERSVKLPPIKPQQTVQVELR